MPRNEQLVLDRTACVLCADLLTDDNVSEAHEDMCQPCQDNYMVHCESCSATCWIDGTRRRFVIPVTDRRVTAWFTYMLSAVYLEYSDGWYCTECVHYCASCDAGYPDEEEAYDCCNNGRSVHDYSYRPMMKFYADPNDAWQYHPRPLVLYMGAEIEVERAASHMDTWYYTSGEDYGNERFVYAKNDGSLYDDGVEFVTMPATLQAFAHNFPFRSFDRLRELGARAWAMTSCGMHVHVSRSAFTPTHLWKFIKFQYLNANSCIAFAGRDSSQWASWNNDTMQELGGRDTAKVVKQGRPDNPNRYSAINMNNRNTIELRYFRPNLLEPGIMRVIEFIDAMYEYTKQMTVADVIGRRALSDWDAFIVWMQAQPKYPNASAYMKERI